MATDENRGYKFYRELLKSPKYILAPMVDASEYPFRELCRRHGAQLAYTPMIAVRPFVESAKIRNEYLYNSNYDRPLIAQFCANDVEQFLKAIALAKDYCDAIDINLGCPQNIARKGHYGAFLQDDWQLISSMIKAATEKFDIPITCKIRVFDDAQRTIDYARMIEQSGAYLLTVHGRTRAMKGQFTGLADWNSIKSVKEAVRIPVFANGNIQTLQDAKDCLAFTGVDGVMSAEGLYSNPALFSGLHVPCWTLIDEYLEIVRRHPKTIAFEKNHLFRMAIMTLQLPENADLRDRLGRAFKLDQFQAISTELRKRYEQAEDQCVPMTNQPLPHYLTQPYYYFVRAPTVPAVNDAGEKVCTSDKKRKKKQQRVLAHVPKKAKLMVICSVCKIHPKGLTCDFDLCRNCCKGKCFDNKSDLSYSCTAHRFNVKKANGVAIGSSKEQGNLKEHSLEGQSVTNGEQNGQKSGNHNSEQNGEQNGDHNGEQQIIRTDQTNLTEHARSPTLQAPNGSE